MNIAQNVFKKISLLLQIKPRSDIIYSYNSKIERIEELTALKEKFKNKSVPEIELQYKQEVLKKRGAMWNVMEAVV